MEIQLIITLLVVLIFLVPFAYYTGRSKGLHIHIIKQSPLYIEVINIFNRLSAIVALNGAKFKVETINNKLIEEWEIDNYKFIKTFSTEVPITEFKIYHEDILIYSSREIEMGDCNPKRIHPDNLNDYILKINYICTELLSNRIKNILGETNVDRPE